MEEWRDIPGYEGFYQVSNLGRVRSVYRVLIRKNGVPCTCQSKMLEQVPNEYGYLTVCLHKYKKSQGMLVHRLVAMAFVPNKKNLDTVNHKDECITNNRADNLEWMSNADNIRYGTAIARRREHQQKPVLQMDMEGNIVASHEGIVKASKVTGISRSNIGKCCKGKSRHRTAGGFTWKYA